MRECKYDRTSVYAEENKDTKTFRRMTVVTTFQLTSRE